MLAEAIVTADTAVFRKPAVMVIALASLLLSFVVGCESGSAREQTVTTDSAGVRITTIAQPLFGPAASWSLAPQPTIDIGVQEGEPAYELDGVNGAGRLADGSIVIANAGSSELRLFDSDGRFVRSFGRSGRGPGEFVNIGWIQVIPPDTVLAMDAELRRATAFTADGRLQWTVAFEGSGYAWPGDIRLPDGTFVLLTETGDVWQRIRAGQARAGRTERNTAVLVRHAPDGSVADTVGRFAGYEEAILDSNGRPATTYPPWGRMVTYALGAGVVFVGTQQSGEVNAYGVDGVLASIVRWPAGDLAITDEDVAVFNEVQFERAPDDAAARQAIVTRTESLPLPDARPAYGRIVIDRLGLLWISEAYIPIAAPRRWTVVEPGSGITGRFDVPDHFTVFEIGPDYILGRWTDDVFAEHVRMFTLRR